MTEEDISAMKRYGITHEVTTTYRFAEHKYQRLEDALSYAKKNQHLVETTNADPKSKA